MKNRKWIVGVLVSMLFATVSFAAVDIGFKGIGGKVGLVDPEAAEMTFGLGVVADLGTIMDNMALEGDITFWTKGYDVGGYDWSVMSFNFAALVKYYFGDASAQIQPFAGGGLGLSFASFSYDWVGGDESDSDLDLGIHLVGGVKYNMSDSMYGFAQFQYVLAGWDFWGIFAGLIFNMSK